MANSEDFMEILKGPQSIDHNISDSKDLDQGALAVEPPLRRLAPEGRSIRSYPWQEGFRRSSRPKQSQELGSWHQLVLNLVDPARLWRQVQVSGTPAAESAIRQTSQRKVKYILQKPLLPTTHQSIWTNHLKTTMLKKKSRY